MKKPRFVPAGFVVVLVALLQLVFASSMFAYNWTKEFADSVGDVGYVTGIAVTGSTVHIVYSDSFNNALRYAKKTGTSWTTEEVAKPGGAGALVLDAAGNPHVSFTFSSGTANSTVVHSTKTGNGPWVHTNIESSSTVVIRESAIALGANGSVHISYRAGFQLKYATNGGGAWATSVVDGGPPLNKHVGSYSSIAVGPNGYPRISYYNLTDHMLMYAEWLGTSWIKDTADGMVGGDTGWYTSLAVGSNGFPHISYYDSNKKQVKYITWDASGRGYWIRTGGSLGEVIDTVGVGAKTSIVLNSQNVPSIAYQGGTLPAFELRYAARTGTGANKWVIETVDTGGAGVGASMKLLADDKPHISYSLLVPSGSPISKLKHAYPDEGLYVVWIIILIIVGTLVFAGMKMRKPRAG
jgi:hypothetical protein